MHDHSSPRSQSISPDCRRATLPKAIVSLFAIAAAALALAAPLHAQKLISAEMDSLIKLGIRLSIGQAYPEAEAVFSKMAQDMPDNPAGYFFQAAVLQTQMMDYEDYTREERFLRLVQKTIELSKKSLRAGQDKAWSYFFMGGAYGYLAFFQGKQKRLFEAFENGRRSVKALEQAVQTDSTLYDAYFGIGTYKYYRSKFSRFFSWLPFVRDERQQGLEMVRRAIEKSKYSRYSALNGYCWLLIDEERYTDGLRLIQSVRREFPKSRIFLWCAAKLNKKLKRWQAAALNYEAILAGFREQGIASPYNELVCRKNLGQIYLRLGDFTRAEAQCEEIRVIPRTERPGKKFSHTLKKALKACQDLSDRIIIGEVPDTKAGGPAQ